MSPLEGGDHVGGELSALVDDGDLVAFLRQALGHDQARPITAEGDDALAGDDVDLAFASITARFGDEHATVVAAGRDRLGYRAPGPDEEGVAAVRDVAVDVVHKGGQLQLFDAGVVHLDQEPHHDGRARCRELPVRGKALRRDRHRVGVPLDAHPVVLEPQDLLRNLGEHRLALGLDLGAPRVEQDLLERAHLEPALEALDLINVEYEVLPAVFDIEEAMKEGAPQLHDEYERNIVADTHYDFGDVDAGFKESDHVREDHYYMQPNSHGCLEPRGILVDYDITGKFTVWTSTQSPFHVRRNISGALAIPLSKVRIIKPTVGGGFGGKVDTHPMHIAAAMGCPVVALFGPTAPWRTGPYGQRHKVIRADVDCSPCFKKSCSHMKCMEEIGVEQVFEAVKDMVTQI